tara:strand:- start:1810 stop:2052 length:243 start_codon:yes stop_codon:yes gene_type:complete
MEKNKNLKAQRQLVQLREELKGKSEEEVKEILDRELNGTWKMGLIQRTRFPINDEGDYGYGSVNVDDSSLIMYEDFIKLN